MKDILDLKIMLVSLLIFPLGVSSQNVGINTSQPNNTLTVNGSMDIKDSLVIGAAKGSAHFDLTGNANFRGVNSNTFVHNPYPSAVNFYTGRVFNTLSPDQQTGDISFQFGGNNGGFRHFLVTRHSFEQHTNSNAFDFYVNNSATNTGSQYPGLGNVPALSASALGVGIGTLHPTEKLEVAGNAKINNALFVSGNSFLSGNTAITANAAVSGRLGVGTATTPVEQFYVNGNARVETEFLAGGNSFFNARVNIMDKLAIGVALAPAEKLYVNGNAKVENDFLVAGNVLFTQKLNILNKLAIGTGATPGENLYVNGLAKIEGDFSVAGSTIITGNASIAGTVNMGLTYQFSDYIIPPNQTIGVSVTCPAGSQLVSGGGGNNVFNGGTDEVQLNYNGPEPNNPLKTWMIYARNTGAAARPLRIYCLCARIN